MATGVTTPSASWARLRPASRRAVLTRSGIMSIPRPLAVAFATTPMVPASLNEVLNDLHRPTCGIDSKVVKQSVLRWGSRLPANQDWRGAMIQESAASPADGLRLLLVEDDPDVVAEYQAKLRLDGYSVEVAEDGPTGLRMAVADPPDLVFLDQRLRWVQGNDLLRALRKDERTRSTGLVVLSMSSGP